MEYTINEDGSITRFNLPKELVGRPLLADLKFTKQQLLAIAKLGFLISASDGNISQDERQCIAAELLQISSGSFTNEHIHECMSFPNELAEAIIRSLPDIQKMYVKVKHILNREDIFLDTHTSRVYVSSSSSSSGSSRGGSSTHRSSSGRSHGGGGRRF